MKYFLTFFLIFCLACKEQKTSFVKTSIIPSKIDSLKTKEEIQNFVQKLDYPFVRYRDFDDSIKIYKALKKFQLKKIKNFHRGRDSIIKIIADSLNVTKSFYKADIDNNGFTDLVIIGDDKSCSGGLSGSCDYSVYALMSFESDSINPVNLMRNQSTMNYIVPKLKETNDKISLIIFEPPYNYRNSIKKTELAYKYGTFVENNNNPKNYNIEKIEYETEACFGECPIFKLTIYNNREAKLNAIEYNTSNPNLWEYEISQELKGKFKTTVDNKNYREIVGLLNYLDFPTLEDYYHLSATDLSASKLTITYNNGKKKTISDYGKIGTLGLKKVYKLISNLRTNQEWENISIANDNHSATP